MYVKRVPRCPCLLLRGKESGEKKSVQSAKPRSFWRVIYI